MFMYSSLHFLRLTPAGIKPECGSFLDCRRLVEAPGVYALRLGIPARKLISLAFGSGRTAQYFAFPDIVEAIISAVHFVGIVVHELHVGGEIPILSFRHHGFVQRPVQINSVRMRDPFDRHIEGIGAIHNLDVGHVV